MVTIMFGDNDTVVTMGSCFADRLRNWLNANGKGTSYINVSEGLNNSFAVRQYLEWALTETEALTHIGMTTIKHQSPSQWQPRSVNNKKLLQHSKDVSAVVVTFGLGEVWKDVETNNVFWRGVSKSYDRKT